METATLPAQGHAPVMQYPGDVQQSATATSLLHLPDELLLHVSSYLASKPLVRDIPRRDTKLDRRFLSPLSQALSNTRRYSHKDPVKPHVSQTFKSISRDSEGFVNNFTSSSDLLNLALTCKHLSAIAQEALHKDVLLPQRCVKDSTRCPRLVSFLRTLIERPDLTKRTRSLAVWIPKSKHIVNLEQGICTCSTCLSSLRKIVGSVKPQALLYDDWMQRYIQQSTEAQICGLIFAALPNLTKVELHRVTIDRNPPISQWPASLMGLGTDQDAQYLTAGLQTGKIDALALSADWGEILTAGLSNIKTLMIGYGPDSQTVVKFQGFPNVTTLTVRGWHASHPLSFYQWKLEHILACFPKTIKLVLLNTTPGKVIPNHIKHIVIRSKTWDDCNVSWCCAHLRNLHPLSALRRIDVDREGLLIGSKEMEAELDDLAKFTGVEVVVWRGGKVKEDCSGMFS